MLKVYYTLKKHAALLQPRYRLSFVQAVHSCAADDTMEYIEYTMQEARDPNVLSRPWRQDGHCVSLTVQHSDTETVQRTAMHKQQWYG